jgi:ribosome-associated toxin RatA of RatAB toxin-antitoxin module
LSSLTLLQTEAVYQTKETGLSGRNHLTGFSVSLTRRLLKQLFLNLGGEWLVHTDREDEYRLAMSLRYDFYQIDTGELP